MLEKIYGFFPIFFSTIFDNSFFSSETKSDLLNAIKVVCSIKPSSGHSSDSNDEVLETAIRISTK